MTEATGQPDSADAAMDESPPFPSPWKVTTKDEEDKDVPRFRVKVPGSTLQDLGLPVTYKPPAYLRLDVRRRKKFRIWRTQRPVLVPDVVPGGLKDELLVSRALKKNIEGSGPVAVSAATRKAFRWYRFIHSGGPVFITVASASGALLVALGALWWGHGLGYGLVIGGIALTVLSVIGVVAAAWRAPD